MHDLGAVVAFARSITGRAYADREVVVKERDALSVVELGSDAVAFVARDGERRARLARERRLLARIGPRLSFEVPRPLGPIDAAAPADVRSRVAGATGRRFEDALRTDRALGRRAAAWMADALAQIHGALASIEIDALGLGPPEWPFDGARLRSSIAAAALDGEERARAIEVCARWEARCAASRPREDVLLHADFGTHNLAFDAATGVPIGLFDFHDAGRGPRSFDMKLLPRLGPEILEDVLDGYAARARAIDLGEVLLVHAATALSALTAARDPAAMTWAREAVGAALRHA